MVTVNRRGIRVSCLWDEEAQRKLRRRMAWQRLVASVRMLVFGV